MPFGWWQIQWQLRTESVANSGFDPLKIWSQRSTSNVKVRRHTKGSRWAGDRRMIAGKRFRTPGLQPGDESSCRLDRIDQLWLKIEAFHSRGRRNVKWTDIALWAAHEFRHGKVQIPLPSIDDVLASFANEPYHIDIKLNIDRYTNDTLACNYPPEIEGLSQDEQDKSYDLLSESFPSINWCLPASQSERILDFHESQARYRIERPADAQGSAPPEPNAPLVNGTLHEALESFEAEWKNEARFLMARSMVVAITCFEWFVHSENVSPICCSLNSTFRGVSS